MITKHQSSREPIHYFARAGRGSRNARSQRTPELRNLTEHTVAIFGLGCLGAPCALELARAGVGQLRILDHDFVDPATTSRWPLGLTAAGLYKAHVVEEFIRANYPATIVSGYAHRLGGVRPITPALLAESNSATAVPEPQDGPWQRSQLSDQEVLRRMTEGASLIYDATAEPGIHYLLSDYAAVAGMPYIGIVGTQGGWGGKVFRILPNRTEGCWLCYRWACDDGTIPEPPFDNSGTVQPAGCADPTFTGAGFDMLEIALHGVRTAVSTLCSEYENGYPGMEWDAIHIQFRSEDGQLIAPFYNPYNIARHQRCPRCND
jgi:molybdopterin/thiamine biosynthesis adenylyltransferase